VKHRGLTIRIGVVKICFDCPSHRWETLIKTHYRTFMAKNGRNAIPVTINGIFHPDTNIPDAGISATGDGWRIARSDFVSFTDKDFRHTLLGAALNRYSFNSWLRVFMTLVLAREGGMLLHSAGISHNGNTLLFGGVSGSGKSTITKILGKNTALSDELTLIYEKNGVLRGASAPFWGELKKDCGRRFDGPLKGIYFISHGQRLSAEKLTAAGAIKRILGCALFFSKDPAHVDKLLAISEKAARSVPVCSLEFSLQTTRQEILKCTQITGRRHIAPGG